MDVHKDSIQFARLEVVDSGRRRRWSALEKERIVAESCIGRGAVAATARRHNIPRTLLAKWRREAGISRSTAATLQAAPSRGSRSSQVEVRLPNGIAFSVGSDVDPDYLRQIVRALR